MTTFTVIEKSTHRILGQGECSDEATATLQGTGDGLSEVLVGQTPPAGATHYDPATGAFVTLSEPADGEAG
jgi:hypothetical protein